MLNYWQSLVSEMNVSETLKQAIADLNLTSPSARIDAEVLLCSVLGVSRAYLYTHPEARLAAEMYRAYRHLIEQRMDGQPIAYLLKHREFWSLSLTVSPETLIPRPDTELLVEKTLALLPSEETINLLELGTGSGAIACALAVSRPNWKIFASDISEKALLIAKKNATQHQCRHITFLHSDWFEHIPTQPKFSAIISNPPYLSDSDPHLEQGDLRFEPKHALISGANGLESLQWIIEHSYNRLLPNGYLILEHGFEQGPAVSNSLSQRGYQSIQRWQDYQGLDRVTSAQRAQH